MTSSQRFERKNYSKLTAQMVKNTVKRRISEIRNGGAGKADALLNDLLQKMQKNDRNHTGKIYDNEMNELFGELKSKIEKNRTSWRNFLIELSVRYDPERITQFGVGLIYGGILTMSVADKGWISVLNTDKCKEMDDAKVAKLREIVSQGRRRGNYVWVIKGKEGMSSDVLKICRFEPECTFILCISSEMERCTNFDEILSEIKRSTNITPMISDYNESHVSEFDKKGILYLIGSIDKVSDGEGKGSDGIYSNLPTHIDSIAGLGEFLSSPVLPIKTGNCYGFLCGVESIISGVKGSRIPEYDI